MTRMNKYDKKHHERLMNQRKNRRSSSILRHHDGRIIDRSQRRDRIKKKKKIKLWTQPAVGQRKDKGRGEKGRLFQTAYLGCDGYRIR